jgi:hypothetical protein
VLQAISIGFALAAVACIALAVALTVRGDPDERRGFALRLTAVACFAIAVVVNVLR